MQISISLFSYQCWDERKKVVNIYEDSDLLDILNVTCLYNGSWSHNPTNFGCNGKLFFLFLLFKLMIKINFQNAKESMIHQMERSNVNLKSMPWIPNVI